MPQNSFEKIFFVGAMLVGFFFGSSLIASLSSAMVEYQMNQKDKTTKMRELRQFLQSRHVGSRLALQVQKQALACISQRARLLEVDVPILLKISAGLRQKLHFSIQEAFLNQHPLLRLCIFLDTAFMQRLSSACIDFLAQHAQDEIFVTSILAKHTYLLTDGTVQYTQDLSLTQHGAPIASEVTSGQWLCEAALWCQWMHVGVAEAITPC